MRYVSWFGNWIGRLMPVSDRHVGHRAGTRCEGVSLSNEDLFYIAMLGPHV
ncbi:hypothetical protein ACQR1W_16745 [Bradyrhizobium sp. HKCCYLS1011]|uniref:hypothetical protein n=1 Tax=Bradyrhizobium sp. HKCCYLS1011 TaxID=3420733 RepID=UPI003EBBFD03